MTATIRQADVGFVGGADVIPVAIEYASVVPGYARMIAGYSLTSRLDVAYRGPCVRLRRASDDEEQDFYVSKDSVLTTSLHGRGHTASAWGSNAEMRIKVWYDQTGNEDHAVQYEPDLQPRLDTETNSLKVENNDATFLLVPPRATKAIVDAQESSIVLSARSPHAGLDVVIWEDNDTFTPLIPLLSCEAATGRWSWWEDRMSFEPGMAPMFETLTFTADAEGSMVAYRDQTGSTPVATYFGSPETDVYSRLIPEEKTVLLRVSGELQHLYLFDAASWVNKQSDFGFSARGGSFVSSNAYINSESLIIKDRSSDVLSLLPAPLAGSGVVRPDHQGIADRIRSVAGEHLWQMQSAPIADASNLEQDAFSNAMALRGPAGDLVLWGEAFMSNAVWISHRLTVGSNVSVVGGDFVTLSNSVSVDIYSAHVTMSNADFYLGKDARFGGNVFIDSNLFVNQSMTIKGPVRFESSVDIGGHLTASNAATFFGPTDLTGSLLVYSNVSHFSNVRLLVEACDVDVIGGTFNVASTAHAVFETGLFSATPAYTPMGPDRASDCGLHVQAMLPGGQSVIGFGEGMFLEGRVDRTLSVNVRGAASNGPAPRRLLVDTSGRVSVGESAAAEAMLNVATISNVPNLAFQDFDDSSLRHVLMSDHTKDTLAIYMTRGDRLGLLLGSNADLFGMHVPTDVFIGSNNSLRLKTQDDSKTAARITTTRSNELFCECSNVSLTAGPLVDGLRLDNSRYGSRLTLRVQSPATELETSHHLLITAGVSNTLNNAITVSASNNFVGIGLSNNALPQYALHVDGNIFASRDVKTLSDAREKTDVRVIEGALDRVRRLRGCTFEMHGDRSTGLIAQEVRDVLPEAVHCDLASDRLSLAYGNIVGLLVEAIKDLDRKVDQLAGGSLSKS